MPVSTAIDTVASVHLLSPSVTDDSNVCDRLALILHNIIMLLALAVLV